MSSETHADVLVIGAGPAGSVAGAALARRGHNVVCVERQFFPRTVIGESLLPRCNQLLDRVGLLKAVESRNYMVKHGATFLRQDRSERFLFAEGLRGDCSTTFQVPRDDFDMTLATETRRLGVDLRFGRSVESVEFGPERHTTLVTDLETSETCQISSRFVLDCSGYGQVLPRLLKLDATIPLPSRTACYFHVENDRRPAGEAEGDIWICVHPRNGWIWLIPFSNGRSSVGFTCDDSFWKTKSGTSRQKLVDILREEPNVRQRLRDAIVVTPTREMTGYSTKPQPIHGPGWALAGNAAGFLDPVFSSGVCLAMESASRASALIDRELAGTPVRWDKEYVEPIDRAMDVFLAFVKSWYSRDAERLFFSKRKPARIKRFVTSILGGNVLRDDNWLTQNAVEGLRQLQDSITQAQASSTRGHNGSQTRQP